MLSKLSHSRGLGGVEVGFFSSSTRRHSRLTDVDTPHTVNDIADNAIETNKIQDTAVTLGKLDPTTVGWRLLTTFAASNVGAGAYTDCGIVAVAPVFLIRARIKNGTLTRADVQVRINNVASGSYDRLRFNGAIPILETGINTIPFAGVDGVVDAIQEVTFEVGGDQKGTSDSLSLTPKSGHIDGTAYTAWGALQSNVGVSAVSINVNNPGTDINGEVYVLETLSTDV